MYKVITDANNLLLIFLAIIYIAIFITSIIFTYKLNKTTSSGFYKKYELKDRILSLYSLRFISRLEISSEELNEFKQRNDYFKKYLKIILILAILSFIIILVWVVYQFVIIF